MSYDKLYIQYLHYFNTERDYFECHEVMEELWMEEGRDALYQGLLQVAVGLYHARNDNVNGAIKLFSQALDKITRYPDQVLGIDLAQLVSDSERYRDKLVHNEQTPFPFRDMNIVIIDPELAQAVLEQGAQ